MVPYLALLIIVILFLYSAIKILNEYERGVIFRLGRVIGAKGPGLILLIPVIDKMVRVGLRVVALEVFRVHKDDDLFPNNEQKTKCKVR
jgi:regulator of protease activity HflC (stomatin/prohibitin superfamily)